MKKIKRILTVILVIIMCLNFGTLDSKAAASVSIALSASSISMGDSVSATISVSGSDIVAYDIYVSYDSSVLQFNSGSGSAQANGGGGTVRLVGTSAGSTTLSFTAIGNGSCYISTSGSECYDINYNQISISHAGASVTVATASNDNNNNNPEDSTTEDDDRSSNCNLKSLQISPGTLEPAFSPSTTSYFVQVDEDVTSMVVSAVAEDENATTAVRGAGLIEPGANTVTVTVTAENGAVKVYTLSVAAGEVLGDAKTTINGIEYSFVQSSNGLEFPEGYNEITTEYKDWEVLAFESPNKKIILVCLEPEAENGEEIKEEWFIYDKDKESFTPYREYSSEFNRYVIIEAPEGVTIPAGFVKTELDVGGIGEKAVVYKSDDINDRNIYLVYAINIAGDEGFYWYDAKEKTFLRYAEKNEPEVAPVATETIATAAEPEKPEEPVKKDEGFFNKKNLGILSIGLGILSFLLLITVITLTVLVKRKDNEDEEDDADITGDLYDDIVKPVIKNQESVEEEINPVETDAHTDKNEDSSDSSVQEYQDARSNEMMTEDEARRAYEEDREVTQNIPASFDLSKMKEDTASVDDRNISIMSFKKKEADNKSEEIKEDVKEAKEEVKEEVKEVKEEVKEAKEEVKDSIDSSEESEELEEIETIKFDFKSKDNDSDEDKKKRDYENDYEKQSEAINNKIRSDYDAEKDSAFSDESDK